MTKQITIEEALELVSFKQNEEGEWQVEDVCGNVCGDVIVHVYPEQIRRLSSVQLPRPELPPLVEGLSERELEVTTGVSHGLTNKAIAASLGITLETVKSHVVNAMGKLGARGRTQLAVMALLYGLIDPLG